MFFVQQRSARRPRANLRPVRFPSTWFGVDDIEQLSTFSSICFLFARTLTDMLDARGGGGEKRRVFGLIGSSVKASVIERWMDMTSLKMCSTKEMHHKSDNKAARLYNAMVYPFFK